MRKVLPQETVMRFFSEIIELCVKNGDHRTVAAIMDRFDEAPHCIKPDYQQVNHVTVYLMLCRATLVNDTSFICGLLGRDQSSEVDQHGDVIHDWQEILVPALISHAMPLSPVLKIAKRAGKASAMSAILLCASLIVKKSPMHSLNLSSLGLTEDFLHRCDLQSPDMLNLTTVILSHNPIKALLPLPRGSFPALTRFLATDCQLKTVPAELFLLPALQEIRLTDNSLVSLPDLPDDSSSSVVYLHLSYNRLTTIPSSFYAPMLQHLELQCNCLSEFPRAILAMNNLRYLKLSNNPALRVIPFSIRWLKNLDHLILEGLNIDNMPRLYSEPMALGYFKGLSKSISGVEHFEAVFVGTGRVSQTQEHLEAAVRSLSTRYGFSVIFSPSPTRFLSTVETILKPPQVFVIAVNSSTLPSLLPSLFKPVLKTLSLMCSKTEVVVAICCEVSIHSPSKSGKRKNELLSKKFMCEVEKLASEFPTCNITPCPVNITISSQLANCDLPHFMKLLQSCSSKVAIPTALPQYQSVIDRHFDMLSSSGSSQEGSTDSLPGKQKSRTILHDRALQKSLTSIESDPSLPELNWLLKSLELQGKLFTLCNRQGIVFDRQWLCDFVLRAVNVVHINAFSREGFLPEPAQATIFSGMGLGDNVPSVLIMHLMRTGVAFPLNQDVYFVPHTLKHNPEPIPLDHTCSRVISAPILLPGFWNRLLAHLTMNTNALLKSATQETSASPTDTCPPEQVLVEHWTRGMVARKSLDQLCFAVRQETFTDEDAVGIIVPLSVSGMRLLTKLFNVIMSLLYNWYPSIWPGVKVWIPCSQCRLNDVPQCHFYPFLHCARRLLSNEPLCCPVHEEADVFPLSLLPDLLSEMLHGTFGTSIQLTGTMDANTDDPRNISDPHAPTPQEASSVQSDFERQLFMLLELSTLKCPHLVMLQEVNLGHPPTLTCSTKEYIPLASVIEEHGKVERQLALHILMQVAEGLTVLHTNGIIHRDISSQNILVQIAPDGSAVDAKISGLTHAGNVLYRDSLRGRCGKHPAPEMSWDKEQFEYDGRVDVYSFAFLACEILTGKLLDPNQKEHSTSAVEPLASTAPLLLTTLHRMWQKEPGKRPYSSDVLHVFLQAQTLLPIKYKIVTGEKKCCPQCTVMSFPLPSSVSRNGEGGPIVFYGSTDEEQCAYFQRYSSHDLAVEATRDVKTVDEVKRGCMLNNFLFAVHNLKTVSVFDMKQPNVTKKLTFPSEVVSVDTDGVSKVVFGLNGCAKVHVMGDSLEEFALQSTLTVFDCEVIQLVQCFSDSIFFASRSKVKAFDIHSLTETQCWLVPHVTMIGVPFQPGTGESFGEIWTAHESTLKITILFTEKDKRPEVVDCSDCYVEECSYGTKAVHSLCAVADVMWVALSKGTILILDSTTRNPLTVLHLHNDYSYAAGALSVYPAPKVCVWPSSKRGPDSQSYKHPQPIHFTVFSTGIGLNSAVFTERHAKIAQSTPVLHHGLYIIAVASMTASEHLQMLEARSKNFSMEIFRLCHVNHAGALLGNPSSTMRRYTEQVVPTFKRRVTAAFANFQTDDEDPYVSISPQASRSRPLFTSKVSVRGDPTCVHHSKEPTDSPPPFHRKSTFISEKLFDISKYSSKVPTIKEVEEYKESPFAAKYHKEEGNSDLPKTMPAKMKPTPKPRLKKQLSSESGSSSPVPVARQRRSSDIMPLHSRHAFAHQQPILERGGNREGACSELGMAVVVNENTSTEQGAYCNPSVVTTVLLPTAHSNPTYTVGDSNALKRAPIPRWHKLKKGPVNKAFNGQTEAYELTPLPSTKDSVFDEDEEEDYEKMESPDILELQQQLPPKFTTHGEQSSQSHHCDVSGMNNQATVYTHPPRQSADKHVHFKQSTSKIKHSYVNISPIGEAGHEEEQEELDRKQVYKPPYLRHHSTSRSSDDFLLVPPSREEGGLSVQNTDSRAASPYVNAMLLPPYSKPPSALPRHKHKEVQKTNHRIAGNSAASVKEKTQSKHAEGEEERSPANQHQSTAQLSSKKVPLRPTRSHPAVSSQKPNEAPGPPYVNIRPLDSTVVTGVSGHKTSKPGHHGYVNLTKTLPPPPPPAHTKPKKFFHSQRSRDTDQLGYLKMTPTEENPKSHSSQTVREDSGLRHRLDSTIAHVKVAEAEDRELEDTIEQPRKYF